MIHKSEHKFEFTFPSFALGFFFLSSSIFLSYSKSLISLRFHSDDFQQVIDQNPVKVDSKSIFYQSKNIIVFNLNETTLDDIPHALTSRKDTIYNKSLQITFSDIKIKNKFYRMTVSLGNADKENVNLKKLLAGQTKANVSRGQLCFLMKCTSNFIAFKSSRAQKLARGI